MVELIIKKIKTIKNIKIPIYHCLFGLLGTSILLASKAFIFPAPPSIATVDLTRLVHQYTVKIAKDGGSLSDIKNKMGPWSQHLESVLQSLSEKHRVVLMPRQAVLSGVKDYTTEVAERLTQ